MFTFILGCVVTTIWFKYKEPIVNFVKAMIEGDENI